MDYGNRAHRCYGPPRGPNKCSDVEGGAGVSAAQSVWPCVPFISGGRCAALVLYQYADE